MTYTNTNAPRIDHQHGNSNTFTVFILSSLSFEIPLARKPPNPLDCGKTLSEIWRRFTRPTKRVDSFRDEIKRRHRGKENSLAYVIEYSPRRQRIVVEAVDRQLLNEPDVETRNRKPMRPNPVAPWELRIGDLRVYYEVSDEPQPTVTVLAIGVKERDRVRIGGEIIKL